MKKHILLVFGIALLSSCNLQFGYLQLTSKEDEIIATPIMKEFLKEHPNPTIVLKAPTFENRTTRSDQNSYLYNAIEKELVLAGFNVKDRGLFNEVLNKSEAVSYEEVAKLTNTELILELVDISTKVEYGTNTFYDAEGKPVVSDYEFTKYGASIEFKVTIIATNEFAGSYTFNYAPCATEEANTDCECEIAYKKVNKINVFPDKSYCQNDESSITTYEYVSKNVMETFVRNGVKSMIAQMKG